MRGWGKPPICKASIPYHGLRIRDTHNCAEEGKKCSMVGRGRPAKSVEMRSEALGYEEGLKGESEF
jgi:hypothetical protein